MKEQLEDLFKTLDHQIDVCRSSIFTANDVKIMYYGLLPEILQIIEKNTVVQFPKINEKLVEELQLRILDRFETSLNHGRRDYVDYSSAEFEIEYDNKLVLSRIDLDESALSEALEEAIAGACQQIFNIEEDESE
jgi:hypothetical protein